MLVKIRTGFPVFFTPTKLHPEAVLQG